jgi:uncharacterized paraquat-inducible protein A
MGFTTFNFEILVRIFYSLKFNFVNIFRIGIIKEASLLPLVEQLQSGGSSYYLFCAAFCTTLSG